MKLILALSAVSLFAVPALIQAHEYFAAVLAAIAH